ncbi:bacterial Ig-like domain-containing protein [Lactococcus garvieae]|uniref:bacterial Ig-like domain-containing protein n=1 Tax=Lactococcus garvieae TaxID=1363 RepID=UPI00288CC59C|nr:bacterial Ig-like domain-containing protein [Lactococcus garvieae]MDT2740971.1 bacterial Ig-like domain-containing protein [Lactococcus garvieae]
MDRKEKTIRYKIRTGMQWLLVSLLTTSTILPSITATVSASTKEIKVSQNIDTSQEELENSSVDNKNREALSLEENDERDTATLITSESVKMQNNNTNDIEKITRESDDIASGVLGTSEWRIDSEGTLHIGGGVLESAGDFPEWGEFADQIEKITFNEKVTGGASLKNLFSGLYAVVSIEGLSNFDTSNVTDMSGMFMGMGALQELFISNFITSKVTSMKAMFMGMDELSHLDVSNFDTSNVTDMSNMFEGAYVLADIEVSNFNTSNVNDMHSMFAQMESLQTLDLSNFNTSNVEDMSSMFAGQYSLNKLILGPSFRFVGGIEPEIEKITSQGYTGKWVNVSSGTVNKPLGKNIWDSDELMLNYNGTTDADTYVWQRESIPAENVVVKYNDEDNNSIADEVILTGNIGEEYTSSKKDIEGYNFKKVKDENATGIFSDQPQEVVYVYEIEKNHSSVVVHDSEITVGDVWSAEDNFDQATDYYGNNVPFPEISVSGEVDTSKTGTYKVTYKRFIPNFLDSSENQGTYSAIATITVKDKQTALNVHDSILYVGDKWSAEDNFDFALDKDGKPVDFKDITVTGEVDTSKAGTYDVTYSYDGMESVATVTVLEGEVEQDLAHITVHDSELKVGENWSPEDNFDEATSFDGKDENFSDIIVEGDVDTTQPGTYEVTYSIPEEHWGRGLVEGHHTATAKIVVTEENSDDNRDSNPKEEGSTTDNNNSSSAKDTSREKNTQNTKELPKTGEHTSALIFMLGIALLVLGSIFGVLRIKKNKK